ncbi:hypothetical protein [Desulfuribacillus alkaliarsenatis]|uniref:Secreted protein n=1 Tax=Desulfuribacillus alkaliarsenatis TaxID=766136 RepID=A0A1E5G5D0_9FIRM|nr:hypothetical protein [Desulfuribacillus alkaliarsenatis]OEF98305.1 hypothetical protein BHF68_01090 [Desulfuribacillus alkaliarsenatis]
MKLKKMLLSIMLVFAVISLIVACSPAERPEAPATEPDYPDRPLNEPQVPVVDDERQQELYEDLQPGRGVDIDEDRLGEMRHQLEQRAPIFPQAPR